MYKEVRALTASSICSIYYTIKHSYMNYNMQYVTINCMALFNETVVYDSMEPTEPSDTEDTYVSFNGRRDGKSSDKISHH